MLVTRVVQSASKCQNVRYASMYTEQQSKLGRPVSPHVEIYAFPVTALSSITNRMTGIALSAGFGGAAVLGLVGADIPAMVSCCQSSIPGFTPVAKFAVAFPLSFHYLGGLRHLIWDTNPWLLETKPASLSSGGLFAAAAVLSLGASMYTISEKKEESIA